MLDRIGVITLKVAMWTLGIFILGILSVLLISLFGNITVTDQLNYTTMKNTVEASMYDALDVAHYRTGFCLCTNLEFASGKKWVFNDDKEYELSDIKYDKEGQGVCESKTKKNCRTLFGEYRIKPKVFSESLIRRFAEMVTNDKNYKIIIQDIIEYPPKVSVKVISDDDEFVPTDDDGRGYSITNLIDAIIEVKNEVSTELQSAPKLTSMPKN